VITVSVQDALEKYVEMVQAGGLVVEEYEVMEKIMDSI